MEQDKYKSLRRVATVVIPVSLIALSSVTGYYVGIERGKRLSQTSFQVPTTITSPKPTSIPVLTAPRPTSSPDEKQLTYSGTSLTYSPEQAKTIIANRAASVISALDRKDTKELSTYIDRIRGLSLTAGVCGTDPDLIPSFTSEEIKTASSDNTVYMWGRLYESGNPVKKTLMDFLYQDIYDKAFANAPEINYNRFHGWRNNANCLDTYFNKSLIEVEYFIPGPEEYAEIGGAGLHLVFLDFDGVWELTHIARQF